MILKASENIHTAPGKAGGKRMVFVKYGGIIQETFGGNDEKAYLSTR